MTIRLLVVVMLELQVVEVNANGFIRPSKSPADASRQAGKGLILLEDFLSADASMTTKRIELFDRKGLLAVALGAYD